jgi:hypothetical protein
MSQVKSLGGKNRPCSTKKKTLGYLPRVLFFNAFELGTESGN